MPQVHRKCPAGLPVHIILRGNNRQVCFASESDFKAYAHWLFEASLKFSMKIHAWVFMTNHVHLLLTPLTSNAVSKSMQYIGRYYVRYFNFTYRRTGTLYEGRFKSSIVQSREYLLACQRYIELNPVRAGMVKDPSDYSWSSYRAHALGADVEMWTPHAEYLALGANKASRMTAYRNLFRYELEQELITEIRNASKTGMVLGNERFRKEIEQLTGQRQHHLKRGPKPKTRRDKEFLL
jgi:putative transposase